MSSSLPSLQPAAETRPEIAFIEHTGLSGGRFLEPLLPTLRRRYRCNYINTTSLPEVRAAIRRADIVWLEFASELTARATREMPALRAKPVICRVHGFEVFTDLIANTHWKVIDHIVFVAHHKRAIFRQRMPEVQTPMSVLRNGIDRSAFSLPERKTNTKNLVLLGALNFRKGLHLLLHFYHELLKRDESYHLYVRGNWQDARYHLGAMTIVEELDLQEKITFVYDWIDDLNRWFADKSHILSFSIEESFHYTIGEGMAAGLKPVIHAWRESRAIWPEEFIFNDLDGFLQLVLEDPYEPTRYRQLLSAQHRDLKTQADQVQTLLAELNGMHLSTVVTSPATNSRSGDNT